MLKKLVLFLLFIFQILLSLILLFLKEKFHSVQFLYQKMEYNSDEYFIFQPLYTVILIFIPSLILGLVFWYLFKNKKLKKINYFIYFNIIGLGILVFLNLKEVYRIVTYPQNIARRNYNSTFEHSHGQYIDSCFLLINQDLKNRLELPKDYIIKSSSWNEKLSTVPRDTSNFYDFNVTYFLYKKPEIEYRIAKYLIHFNGQFKLIYDLNLKDNFNKNKIDSIENIDKRNKDFLRFLKDTAHVNLDNL